MSTSSHFRPTPASRPIPLRLVPGLADEAHQQLPLEWEVSPGVPAVPLVRPDLRIVGVDELPDELADDMPDPGKWAARLAQAVAEVYVGERPPGQLAHWVTRLELAKLTARAAYVSRHPSARAQRGVPRRRTVRAVRICPVAPGVVEASAVIVGTERSSAIALRLEAVGNRWMATAIDMR